MMEKKVGLMPLLVMWIPVWFLLTRTWQNLVRFSVVMLGDSKKYNWKNAWVKNRIIRIRKSNDLPAIALECVEDLE